MKNDKSNKQNGKSTQNGQQSNGNGMPNAHLHELFVDELRDIMGGERQLVKGLKKMTGKEEPEALNNKF